MNKQQIEEELNKRFGFETTYCKDCKHFGYNVPGEKECGNCGSFNTHMQYELDQLGESIKDFFFDEILPEVLRDIKNKLLENQKGQFESDSGEDAFFLKDLEKSFRRIAKEKYNITL